jgi:hypothetical protein
LSIKAAQKRINAAEAAKKPTIKATKTKSIRPLLTTTALNGLIDALQPRQLLRRVDPVLGIVPPPAVEEYEQRDGNEEDRSQQEDDQGSPRPVIHGLLPSSKPWRQRYRGIGKESA